MPQSKFYQSSPTSIRKSLQVMRFVNYYDMILLFKVLLLPRLYNISLERRSFTAYFPTRAFQRDSVGQGEGNHSAVDVVEDGRLNRERSSFLDDYLQECNFCDGHWVWELSAGFCLFLVLWHLGEYKLSHRVHTASLLPLSPLGRSPANHQDIEKNVSFKSMAAK